MRYQVKDDQELLLKAAREALTRPSHVWVHDDQMWTTHGFVLAWAKRGDDILSESNYHAMLAALEGAVAHDETGASEARGDDVLDATMGHWLVGSLRQIMVRVYVPAPRDDDGVCTACGEDTVSCCEAERGEFTPAFIRAVELGMALQDYPVLDESDFSEREWKEFERQFADAVHMAERDYDDTDAERELFWYMITDRDGPWHDRLVDSCDLPDVDYAAVEEAYAEVRDTHFEYLVHRPGGPLGPLPRQEALPTL